jgi:hypothetical protein
MYVCIRIKLFIFLSFIHSFLLFFCFCVGVIPSNTLSLFPSPCAALFPVSPLFYLFLSFIPFYSFNGLFFLSFLVFSFHFLSVFLSSLSTFRLICCNPKSFSYLDFSFLLYLFLRCMLLSLTMIEVGFSRIRSNWVQFADLAFHCNVSFGSITEFVH